LIAVDEFHRISANPQANWRKPAARQDAGHSLWGAGALREEIHMDFTVAASHAGKIVTGIPNCSWSDITQDIETFAACRSCGFAVK